MIKRTFFLLTFLWLLPISAQALSPLQECQKEAENIKQVNIRYKYGKLNLLQKSTAEISASCGDQASGCFHSSGGKYTIETTQKIINHNKTVCVIPIVYLDYNFSGSYVEITNEYNACKTRAVLRHELQHFMLWKTGIEQQLAQTQKLLKKLAWQKITACSEDTRCNANYFSEFKYLVQNTAEKWHRIIEANNKKLDSNDHDFEKEVNYRVCIPYLADKL